MTHATLSPHTALLCIAVFDYDETAKEAVKCLQGATFDGHNWLVPIMHLPILKLIFTSLTVAPEVVTAYHALLKRMLTDLAGSEHRRGALGQHIADLMERHAVGIAYIKASGWKPTQPPRITVAPVPLPKPEPEPMAEDKGLQLWLRGAKNAAANAEKKAHIVAAVKRKRKKAA